MLEDHRKIILPFGNGSTHLEIPVEQIKGDRPMTQSYVEYFNFVLTLDLNPDDVSRVILAYGFRYLISAFELSSIHTGDHVTF